MKLNDGYEMPSIGFGSYLLRGTAGANAIADAIASGYRLIDSAVSYENEGAVGAAVRAHPAIRAELTITSKLPGRSYRYDTALQTIEESLLRTRLERLEMYLLHWPNPKQDRYVEAWTALIEARSRGYVRSIGVCNFLPEHLERLQRETGVTPAVNQVELHPWFPQTRLLDYHRAHGIGTQAWSPLARGGAVLGDPTINRIASELSTGVGQVILAWHRHLGVVPLPKAGSARRRTENLRSLELELPDTAVAEISSLARPDGRLSGQNPALFEEF